MARHPEDLKTIPVEALFSLLAEAPVDSDFALEIISLLTVAFGHTDVESILSTHGARLQEALQSERPSIVLFAVGLLQRALVPNYVALPEELLRRLCTILNHPDTQVAESVVNSTSKRSMSPYRPLPCSFDHV